MGVEIPIFELMGVKIHLLTIPELNHLISRLIAKGETSVIAHTNIHGMNLAYENPWFRGFLNSCDYVFCDGHGVIFAARIFGGYIPAKITYAHWMPLFAHYSAKNNHSWFLLGSSPGVANDATRAMKTVAPNLRIVGSHHGFFDKTVNSTENQQVVNEINRVSPDVLFVCFGMPIQEKWVNENRTKLNARVILTGGAALDYTSGRIKRPISLLTETGFEWLGRLIQEPRRLSKRYLIGNPLFIARCLLAKISGNRNQTLPDNI